MSLELNSLSAETEEKIMDELQRRFTSVVLIVSKKSKDGEQETRKGWYREGFIAAVGMIELERIDMLEMRNSDVVGELPEHF